MIVKREHPRGRLWFWRKPESKEGELDSILHVMTYQQRWPKISVEEKYWSYSSCH